MPAPNSAFDPVEVVAALAPAEVARRRDEALAAVAAAADLDALKAVRLAHAGDRSPLALANREIGAQPPQAKADAGKRVGAARRAVVEALTTRQVELEVERDGRCHWPTGRSAHSRRRPRPTPASGSGRLGARSSRR